MLIDFFSLILLKLGKVSLTVEIFLQVKTDNEKSEFVILRRERQSVLVPSLVELAFNTYLPS